MNLGLASTFGIHRSKSSEFVSDVVLPEQLTLRFRKSELNFLRVQPLCMSHKASS
jgi:hypothetical protein